MKSKKTKAIEALKAAADAQCRWNENEKRTDYWLVSVRHRAEKVMKSALGSFSRNPSQRNYRAFVRARAAYDKAVADAPHSPPYSERNDTRKKAVRACAEFFGVAFPEMKQID